MGWRSSCVVLIALILVPLMAYSGSIVKNLPGYDGDLPFTLETGYIGVGEGAKVQIFYYFVESQRNPFIDPILLWFVGGPGCSGLSAFFFENGPLIMDPNYTGNLPKLELNPYAWTHKLNMIYIDMPVGTGFSYSETQEDYYSSDILWVEHTYSFLQKWFIDHPKFSSNPFYIGGGSYSGITTGPLVQKVYEGYITRQVPHINIKGYVLASPLVDSYQDVNMRVLYAYHMSLIPKELYESLKENCNGNYVYIDPENTKCVSDYEAYSELVRYINQQQILEPLCITTPAVNNIIQQPAQDRPEFWCRSYDHILIDTWANDENVWKSLHVRKGTKEEFIRCNKTLAYTTTRLSVVDYYKNLTNANLQALVYCSHLDMALPHLGTQYWIKSLNMSTHDKWRAWFVEGQVAGFTEIYKMKEDHYLTYVNVKGAGHVAQTFKPKEVYSMINSCTMQSNEASSSSSMEVEVVPSEPKVLPPKPKFEALKPHEMCSGQVQFRKVSVPPHRYTPLKKAWMDIYTPIFEQMKIDIRMNLKARKVELKTRTDTPDISNLQKCADFVHAFMLGFDVIDAVALLRLDELYVESFEIKDVKTLRGDHLSRAIGRLSGKGGKTKFAIENASKTRIVIADSKIHILGSFANIKIARDSLCNLILGSPAAKVYSKLRAVTARLAERF